MISNNAKVEANTRAVIQRFPALILAMMLMPVACSSSAGLPTQLHPGENPPTLTRTPFPTATQVSIHTQLTPTRFVGSTLVPEPSPTTADTGWQMLREGLERRVINLFNDNSVQVEYLYVLRVDPSFYSFDVAYDQKIAHTLREWQTTTGAILVTNGGYYSKTDDGYLANGLVVVDGQALGSSYGAFAGMLAISTMQGPDLRWLQQQPYSPEEPLLAALQSFPLLVKPGGRLGFPAEYEDHVAARRTVIGQDSLDRILFLVAPKGYFTLHQLSLYLVDIDLDLDIALNLDGGPSSGILLAEPFEEIPALSYLPLVITVYSR